MNSYNNDLIKIIRQIIALTLSIGIALVVYVALSQLPEIFTTHTFKVDFFGQLYFVMTKVWLPWLLISPLLAFLALRFPIDPQHLVRAVIVHLFLLILLSVTHGSAVEFHYHFFSNANHTIGSYMTWQHIGYFLFRDSLFLFNTIIYLIFIISFNVQNFYKLVQQKQNEAMVLNQKLTESKLKTLRMQINPHFLFNTLNVISVLMMKKDNDRAQKMLERLCTFFRRTLEDMDGHWAMLSLEIEMLDQYLSIEKVRFGNRLTVNIHCPDELLDQSIPSMLLQPLVENSIKHGLEETTRLGELSIECVQLGDRMLIKVIDNGAGCDFERDIHFKEGIGLQNVKERLNQIYGKNHFFKIWGEKGKGVQITIELPLHWEVKNREVKNGY